jgi:subtilisin family serine protease
MKFSLQPGGYSNGGKCLASTYRVIVEFLPSVVDPPQTLSADLGKRLNLIKIRNSPRLDIKQKAAVYQFYEVVEDFDKLANELNAWAKSECGDAKDVQLAFLDLVGGQHGELYERLNENSELWKQWYLNKTGLLDYWKKEPFSDEGEFPKIGIFDSGIEVDQSLQIVHPNLFGRKAKIYLRTIGESGGDEAESADQIVDLNGHGTHVSGIIGAASKDSEGVVGICPESEMHIFKCTEGATEYCYLSNLIDSIFSFVLGLRDGENGILNVSIGFGISCARDGSATDASQKWLFDLAEYLRSLFLGIETRKNLLIVAAAGNEFSDQIVFPANLSRNNPEGKRKGIENNNILCVGATDAGDNVVPFSNAGASLSLVAPGKGIYSIYPSLYNVKMGFPMGYSMGYAFLEGTSMAAAIVSGIAAAHWQRSPSSSGKEIAQHICDYCVGGGSLASENYYGFGLAQIDPKYADSNIVIRSDRTELLNFPENAKDYAVLRGLFEELFGEDDGLYRSLKKSFENDDQNSFGKLKSFILKTLAAHGHHVSDDMNQDGIVWGLRSLFNPKYDSIWLLKPLLYQMVLDIPEVVSEADSKLSLFQKFLHQCWKIDPNVLKQFLMIQYPYDTTLFKVNFNEEMITAFIRLSSDENLVPVTPYEPNLGDKNLKCW